MHVCDDLRVPEITLPTDLSAAHAMIREPYAECHELRGKYEDLQHQLDQMARRMYGRRSEQLDPAQLQLAFAALEVERALAAQRTEPSEPAASAPDAPTKPKRPGHGRRPLPAHLPRETLTIEPEEADLVCSCCGRAKVRIGEERAEKLHYHPATFSVVETVRPKYACAKCKDGVTVALAPVGPIVKGLATTGLLTHVIVSKYTDHVPLARLTTIFQRLGVDVPRQTLCGWVAKIHDLLEAVEAAMWRSVLASHVLGADETPVNVLEEGRKQCARGYLWCYVGDQDEVVFDFSMGRGSETPLRALREYGGGVLVCDAYAGYDRLDDSKPGMVRAGCMAHARRKVYEAKDVDPERAMMLLALIRLLYDVEERIRALPCANEVVRRTLALTMRTAESRPVMEQIKEHVARYRVEVLPKSPMGKALGYFENQWTCLSRFLDDGAIPIDNNSVERAIRPVAIGRGNWTFIGSEDAGPWAARLYGLLGTCRLQGINPYEWLKDVLDRVREHPPDRMYELTPRGWKHARAQTPPPA